jgi:hypothetical protein
MMQIVDHGEKKHMIWDIEDPEDVKKAYDTFLQYVKQGWIAAIRDKDLKRVLEFQAEYGELWFIPLAEGG